MRTLIKLTFALALTVVSSANIVAQQKSELVGAYLYRFQWGGSELVLKANGTFTDSSSSCTSVTTASGPYSVSNDVIRFKMLKLTRRGFDDNKERDLTKRKARKKYLDTDEPFKPESWELQVVRWGDRVYLMNRDLFQSFVAAINLGFEPRAVDGYREWYGAFYLREGDENKPVTGPPALPEEFLRTLLPAPLIATVLDVKTEGTKTVATIDRGAADGLRPNMKLVPNRRTTIFSPSVTISVSEHSAQIDVYGEILKVGDQLSTRVPDVLVYLD